ncbi:phenolic acid decarboxylase [Kitasatospora sp. MMS16-BH015]|uniref:UbiD family decarboxylase domain-containing protein n=1 Tax=Kitasatospora sp. MMS16-BH015 TaxID=2018025 RepID=UPI000CA3472E|nr:UbiD family decarboxylase domain-containing protein [Kitasatospora sp. MMS16-BH015]AUG79269.1 phenolic acid decarboxylase [Kitasatospora sp. MMS16-BH015]
MPYDDLRAYLDALDLEQQLLHITEELDTELGLPRAVRAAAELGDHAPGLYLDNLRDHPDAQLTTGLLGSWANHAVALGLPVRTPLRTQVEEFGRRWEAVPPAPTVDRADPPWDEYALFGAEVDLGALLPLFGTAEEDQAPDPADRALVLTALPAGPEPYGRLCRFEARSRNRLTLRLDPADPLARHPLTADLPVVLSLGNDPLLTVAAATTGPTAGGSSPDGRSCFELAAALRQAPCPVTAAPLTGLTVPWGSELLLEGVIEARVPGPCRSPVVRVDRVAHRASPVFDSLRPPADQPTEHLTGPATSVRLLRRLRAVHPEVRAVNAVYGDGRLAVLALAPRHPALVEAVTAHCRALAPELSVITVDDSVDPFDLPQVLRALAAGPARLLDATRRPAAVPA